MRSRPEEWRFAPKAADLLKPMGKTILVLIKNFPRGGNPTRPELKVAPGHIYLNLETTEIGTLSWPQT